MPGKFCLLLLWSFLSVVAGAGTALGADLKAMIDRPKESVILTNTLGYDLYVMYLEGDGASVPVMVRVPAATRLEIPFKGKELPAGFSSATCIFSRPDRLPEDFSYERGSDGFYHLSVQTL